MTNFSPNGTEILADTPYPYEDVEYVPLEEMPKILWAADALKPQPPIDWVVKDLITAGSLTLVVGDPGSKKTFSMIDAAVCVALGKKWLDFKVTQQKVLFIDEESGPRRLARRIGDSLRAHKGDGDTPLAYVTFGDFNLREESAVCKLQSCIEETQAGLVVIDALVDIMAGADENSVKDVHPVFMSLRRIAEATNASIILIHHKNKNGGYRGSTAMSGAIDLMLMVESKSKSSEICFKTQKARDIEPVEFSAHIYFKTDKVWLSSHGVSDVLAQNLNSSKKHVLTFLKSKGNSSVTSISKSSKKLNEGSLRQTVYDLRDDGLIERTNDGGSGTSAIYGLTTLGKEVVTKLELTG